MRRNHLAAILITTAVLLGAGVAVSEGAPPAVPMTTVTTVTSPLTYDDLSHTHRLPPLSAGDARVNNAANDVVCPNGKECGP